MIRNPHFYWFIPLLIAGIVIVAVILLNIQITSFEESYFAELKAEIRQSSALTVEVFTLLLEDNDSRKLEQFFRNREGNPMIVRINAPGGKTVFETPNAPLFLREHLMRPRVRDLMRGPARDEVTIAYSKHYQAWIAYHSLAFTVEGKEYILDTAELCNSVSRIIRLSEFAMIALSSLGLLMVTGLVLYFFRLVYSPLNRLQTSTREITSGNLDYPVFVPKHGIVRDISLCVKDMAENLKGQINELRKLERSRGEFITAISHAMKTPLTGILSAVEGIEQGALDNPEFKAECVKALKVQSQRLAGLLHDFLNLTALELQAAKPERDFIPVSLGDILKETAEGYGNIEFHIDCHDIPEIQGDPLLLRQMLSNLIENAVEHGGTTRIDLSAACRNGQIQLLVRDYGSGIAPEHLDRIFDRFYRASTKRTSAVPGNGLGLAIVKHIVALHDGEVTVSSEQGKGTIFRISLPV